MSNLSNLMISGSYRGLINLQDSTQNLASQSGYVELQDGLGDNVGISIDASNTNIRVNNTLDVGSTLGVTGSSHFRSNVDVDGNLDVSGSFIHTGSIDIQGDVTVEGDITAHTASFDTVNTRVLNVTIETASVIFSSGSNVLGDEITDRQDLIGQVVVSGSLGVEGNSALTGSATISNNLTVNGTTELDDTNISGSTIISGSFTNKQVLSSEQFKVIAHNDIELINIGQVGGKETTLQGDVLLFASGTQPSFELRFNPGTGNQSSTWRYTEISFPSGSYGNAAKINVDGGKQYQFADSVNSEGILGTNDNRTGIFFGTPFAFDGELIIGKDKGNNRTIIGDSSTVYVSSSAEIQTNLTVIGDISSSTVSGIGNVTSYSQSVDNRLDQLESDTGSQDSRLDSLEAFTGSQETLNGFYNSFTASNGNGSLNAYTSSTNDRLDNIETFTASLATTFLSASIFNAYTQSTDNRLNNLEATTSSFESRFTNIESTTASLQSEIDGLSNKTGSYATTGSNAFDGSQEITGSVNGNVSNVSIASSTASFDCSTGNFFTVTLPSGSTQFQASNINPGQTISIKVNLGSSTTAVTTNDTMQFPNISPYIPTQNSGSKDVLSFVSFDSNELLGTGILRLE